MGKNRDGLILVADILEAANIGGTSKTRIMYRANLSFKLLEKYLGAAASVGFIRVEDCKYVLTDHGRDFPKQYRGFQERHIQAEKSLEYLSFERDRLARLYKSS